MAKPDRNRMESNIHTQGQAQLGAVDILTIMPSIKTTYLPILLWMNLSCFSFGVTNNLGSKSISVTDYLTLNKALSVPLFSAILRIYFLTTQ